MAGVLTAHRKTSTMADSAIATDLHQTSDVALNLSAKIAFNLEVAVEHFAQSGELLLVQITHLLSGIDRRALYYIVNIVLSDSVQDRERV